MRHLSPLNNRDKKRKVIAVAAVTAATALVLTFITNTPYLENSQEKAPEINQYKTQSKNQEIVKPINQNNQNLNYERLHPKSFFEKDSFWPAISSVKEKPLFALANPILGATIPHHLIPSPAIATFFQELKRQNPKTLIILSPNHFSAGEKQFLTSNESYPTPFGNVAVEQAIYQKMTTNQKIQGMVEESTDGLGNDHGIGNLMPFIKYYLPETKIIPILIRDKTSTQDIVKLESALAPYISTVTPLLVSVDFSHYLTLKKAQEKDKITWDLIKSWSISQIISLNSNDYLDTPGGIATLLLSMQQKGAKRIAKNYYDNSGNILNQPNIPTTSYFILSFTK
ncbi:AmmeMemoRadiSam system protein B [Candidatus Gracilibacteria bacterium]|nr:AmmeMemoRadiSam system protein B [Candidatus Gracilibacteria bacterium]